MGFNRDRRPSGLPALSPRIAAKYAQLSPEEQANVTAEIRPIIAGRAINEAPEPDPQEARPAAADDAPPSAEAVTT